MTQTPDVYPDIANDAQTLEHLGSLALERQKIIGTIDAMDAHDPRVGYTLDENRDRALLSHRLVEMTKEHIDLRTGSDGAFHPYIPPRP